MTVPDFQRRKGAGQKLTVVTAYDALFARLVEEAGVETILVGDSLGVVVQGRPNTLAVTMGQMRYHTRMVVRGVKEALVIADMPFLSYQIGCAQAVRHAGRLLQAGAQAVKLEGGRTVVSVVKAIVEAGIPVMGHLGMTPQSVNQFGGYRVQGKQADDADRLLEDASALEAAGAFGIVLEAIPADLARRVTERLTIPTIGIGAGPHCDGQVLVLYDLLGLFQEFVPKFVKPYASLRVEAVQAIRQFKTEVEQGTFPGPAHSYR
jgi:3-methyl-2-oxobutanoate hydroxymethyltransferase